MSSPIVAVLDGFEVTFGRVTGVLENGNLGATVEVYTCDSKDFTIRLDGGLKCHASTLVFRKGDPRYVEIPEEGFPRNQRYVSNGGFPFDSWETYRRAQDWARPQLKGLRMGLPCGIPIQDD